MADCSQYPDSAREIKAEQNSTDIEALIAEVAALRARLALLKLDGPNPKMRDIVAAVALENGVQYRHIVGRGGSVDMRPIRQRAYWLCWKAGNSYSAVGRFFGRDHSTIMHGVAAENARRATP